MTLELLVVLLLLGACGTSASGGTPGRSATPTRDKGTPGIILTATPDCSTDEAHFLQAFLNSVWASMQADSTQDAYTPSEKRELNTILAQHGLPPLAAKAPGKGAYPVRNACLSPAVGATDRILQGRQQVNVSGDPPGPLAVDVYASVVLQHAQQVGVPLGTPTPSLTPTRSTPSAGASVVRHTPAIG